VSPKRALSFVIDGGDAAYPGGLRSPTIPSVGSAAACRGPALIVVEEANEKHHILFRMLPG